jgi:hypothetical protein
MIISLPREDRITRQEWLAEVARLHRSNSVKRSAMVALRDVSSPLVRSISLLTLTHGKGNENLRETAIKCLGEVGTEGDLEILQELHQNEQIARFGKQAAANAFARLSKRLNTKKTTTSNLNKLKQANSEQKQPYFDVAISFAGEDRITAESLAHRFRENSIRVFYDMFYQAELIGEDLALLLAKIYCQASRFCIVLISAHYPQKTWPKFELRQVQDRAIFGSGAYIIPVRLDSTHVDGISDTVAHIDLRSTTLDKAVDLICEKIQHDRAGGPRLLEIV